jgi:hypothetical protein
MTACGLAWAYVFLESGWTTAWFLHSRPCTRHGSFSSLELELLMFPTNFFDVFLLRWKSSYFGTCLNVVYTGGVCLSEKLTAKNFMGKLYLMDSKMRYLRLRVHLLLVPGQQCWSLNYKDRWIDRGIELSTDPSRDHRKPQV